MQAAFAYAHDNRHARHWPRPSGIGLHLRAQALQPCTAAGRREHLQQLRQQRRQWLILAHLCQPLAH